MENGIIRETREFQPERLPRRGEIIAWMLTGFAAAAWLILSRMGEPIFFAFKLLAILIAFSALAISLGNWMDRQTRLILKDDGIFFENGLRKVHLGWQEIHQVEVVPSSWGRKVRVLGQTGHFDFRTLGEVWLEGEVKGRMGFEKGEEILREILEKTHLKETTGPGNSRNYSRGV